jgi:hypothetical protein
MNWYTNSGGLDAVRGSVWRMKGECNGEEIHVLGVLIWDSVVGVISMLKALDMSGDISIAGQSALIDESTVES